MKTLILTTLFVCVAACSKDSNNQNNQTDSGTPDAGDDVRITPDAAADTGETDTANDSGADLNGDTGSDTGSDLVEGYEFPPRDFVCANGAATPCDTTEPTLDAEARTRVLGDELDNATVTYVMGRITTPIDPTIGFNLDGLDSGPGQAGQDCERSHADGSAEILGIDSQFWTSFRATLEGILDANDCPSGTTSGCYEAITIERIITGDLLMLVEVTGVESLANDDAVAVTIHRAQAQAVQVEADGTLTAGQSFQSETILAQGTGDIFDGVLRVELDSFTIPAFVPVLFTADITLFESELRMDVSADPVVGTFAGPMRLTSFANAVEATNPGTGGIIVQFLQGAADLSPSAADAMVCDDISVTHQFEGVSATVQ